MIINWSDQVLFWHFIQNFKEVLDQANQINIGTIN